MWPYWLMFVLPAIAVILPMRLKPSQSWVPWFGIGILFALMMGLRHEVGGDWANYLPYLDLAADMSLGEAATSSEASYAILNWMAYRVGGGIYLVNLVCAAILMAGTLKFCSGQPWPWLALLVAVPYMLIVVGMGYTRQAVALGFALLALTDLGRGRTLRFILLVALGATFHKSAVFLLPIAALAASGNRFLNVVIVAITTALLYYLLIEDQSEVMWENYIVSQYHSSGGLVRVLMNVVPALLMIVLSRKIAPDPKERKLWVWISVFAIVCLPLVLLASTAVDRLALYLIPLQLFVFSRLPELATRIQTRTAIVVGTVVYYGTVQFVWLNFGVHARGWLPYQIMPLW